MSVENTIGMVVFLLLAAATIAVYLFSGYWVYTDAVETGNENARIWGIGALCTGLFGLLVYLLSKEMGRTDAA